VATDGGCNWTDCAISERNHDIVCHVYRKETEARAQQLGRSGGPDPPKFGRTTPTFLMKSVILPLRNRLQSTKMGIPSVFCSVQ